MRHREEPGVWLQRALVLRVRFKTGPDLSTRSNSKLPFWLTGEPRDRLVRFVWIAEMRGCGIRTGRAGGFICVTFKLAAMFAARYSYGRASYACTAAVLGRLRSGSCATVASESV